MSNAGNMDDLINLLNQDKKDYRDDINEIKKRMSTRIKQLDYHPNFK